jgi:hypothetical protein
MRIAFRITITPRIFALLCVLAIAGLVLGRA